MSEVIVVPYDDIWVEQFNELKSILWNAVGDFALTIEHVGSTSVPGLAAKPIIDLDIVIPDLEDLDTSITRLQKLGYEYRGNLGIKDREAFKNRNSDIRHNLYVCPKDSMALKNHLCLRDSLRDSIKLRDEYAAIKIELAKKFPNSIDDYIEGKTSFILKILEANGLSADRLEEIRQSNLKKIN